MTNPTVEECDKLHATKANCKWCNNDWPENREYEGWEICEEAEKARRIEITGSLESILEEMRRRI